MSEQDAVNQELAAEAVGLHSLRPAPGAKKDRKRVGRGHGSSVWGASIARQLRPPRHRHQDRRYTTGVVQLDQRDRVIRLARDFSILGAEFADSDHLRIEEITPPAATRRPSRVRAGAETVGLALGAGEGLVPQVLTVRFSYFSGWIAWRPILVSVIALILGNLMGAFMFTREIHFGSRLLYGGGAEASGLQLRLGADVSWRLGAHDALTLSPGLTLANGDFMRTTYGVDARQARSDELPPYDAKAGVRNVGLDITWGSELSTKFTLDAGVSLTRLVGSAARSPLIVRRNEATLFSALSYHF